MPGTCRNCLYLIIKNRDDVPTEFCMYKKDWQLGLAQCRQYVEYIPKTVIYTVARATINSRRVSPVSFVTGSGRVIEAKRMSEDIYLALIIGSIFIAIFAMVLYWII